MPPLRTPVDVPLECPPKSSILSDAGRRQDCMTRTHPADPDWFTRLATTPIPEAVDRLARHGLVVVLAGDGAEIPGLAPATADEITASTRSRNAAGFLLRRRIARTLAAMAGGADAAAIAIVLDANGKPGFAGIPPGLHLGFASRDHVNLVALARHPIGIDLERPLPPSNIPWNILRADEADALQALPVKDQAPAFARLWSAKEAALKASGEGLMQAPETIRIEEEAVFDLAGPEGSTVWRKRPITLNQHVLHGVFHNSAFATVALLSDTEGAPSTGHHS